MSQQITVTTDTASLCMFDPESLKHRMNESPTWWTDRREAIKEINAGNALFVKLGGDGEYVFNIRFAKQQPKSAKIKVTLRCPSGKVFFGASEWTTAADEEPAAERGGYVQLADGNYDFALSEGADSEIEVAICAAEGDAKNSVDVLPSLFR